MAKDKDKFINRAQTLIKKGQVDKAIKEYESALQLDKKDVRLYMRLGDIYAKRKENDKAIDNYLNAAKYLTKDGFYSRAAAVYRQILSVDDSKIEIVQQLADLYTKLGLNNEAMAQYQKISINFEREGKLNEALEVMQKMLDLDPKNVIFATKVAELNYKAGNKENGYRAFRRALDQLQSEGRYEQYVKLLEKLAKADPDNLENLKELASIYVEHDQWDRAFVVLGRIHQTDPEDIDVLGQLSNAALKAGRPDDAVKYLKAMAGIFKAKGLRQRFKEALRKVLQIHPDDPEARAIVGEAEPVLKEEHVPEQVEEVIEGPLEVLEEAESAEEEVLIESGPALDEGPAKALSPDQVMEHLTEAGVYLKYGLRDKALHHVQLVLQADPENVKAHLALKDIQLEAGKTDLAVKELEWVARNGRKHDAADASLAAVQEWLRLEPDNAAAKKLLAEIKPRGPARAPGPAEAEVIHEAEEIEEEEIIEEAAPLEEEEIELAEEEPEAVEVAEEEEEPAEVLMEVEEEPEPVKAPSRPAAKPAKPRVEEVAEEVEEMEVEAGEMAPAVPAKAAAPRAKPAAKKKPAVVEKAEEPEEEVVVEEEEVAEEVVEEEVAAKPAAKPKAPPPPPKAAAPAPKAGDFSDDLEEAEFYLQQGLNDEAKKIYLSILHQDPTHEISLKKLKELEQGEAEEVMISEGEQKAEYAEEPAAPPEPAPPPAAPPPPPKAAEPPPPPKAVAPPPPPPKAVEPAPPPPPAAQAPSPVPPPPAAPPPQAAPPPSQAVAPPQPPVAQPPVITEPPVPETAVPEPFADTAAIEPPPGQPVPVPEFSAPPPAPAYAPPAPQPYAPPPAASAPPAPPAPAPPSAFDLRAELGEDEATDKGFFVGPAPAPATGLFEGPGGDEGGLFDLAAELEKDEELSAAATHGLGSAAEEFSFEETLSAFKKGVARTISEHDSATHYDLGIAYKEMGLHDEAIQEFLTASRDPARYFECMLMSVMIMRERGELDKALRTCKTALLTPGAQEHQMATLYFEMAQAFAAGNDQGRAKWSLEQAKTLHMDHPELDQMLAALRAVSTVPVALEQDVAEVAPVAPAEEPDIDLDRMLGIEPEPGAPGPGQDSRFMTPGVQQAPQQPPADAGPPPSREQTSWQKAALEQPEEADQSTSGQQPQKKRKKISYV